MDIRIRESEGVEDQPFLLWDSTWNDAEFFADWTLSPASEAMNVKGLQSQHALRTSVLIALFTWRRAEEYDLLPTGSDRKGWWGDAVDVDGEAGETALGSKLWLLMRSPLNSRTQQLAEQYATEALQPLVAQGAVAHIDVTTEIDIIAGFLVIYVRMYSKDGDKVYDQKFTRVWTQEFR